MSSPIASRTPAPGARPFVKLFTLIGGGVLDDTSDKHLRFIAETYGWINSHGGSWRGPVKPPQMAFGRSGGIDADGRTAGDRLRSINPGIILTNYCNGAYSNQEGLREAMQAERRLPLAIAVHDTGITLAAPLDVEEQLVRLRPPAERPPGKPPIYPFKASTTNQEHTTDKHRYVAWLRLDDEILRIDEARPGGDGLIELDVRRGYWKTMAAAHAADAVVLQPVYCGAVGADGREYYLSGLPDGNSPQPGVRYVFMQQRREFWDYLAEKVQETLDEGLTGPWFDCAVSSWINHANPYGVRIRAPYDLDLRGPLTREMYREYHQRKHDYFFDHFPGLHLYVNWFFPRHYWADAGGDAGTSGWSGGTGGGAGGNERLFFSGENGHRPISGGVIEMYANERFMDWRALMRMQIGMRDHGYCVVCWAKRADTGSDAEMPHDYQLFAYTTHLLVYEPDAPQFWGAAWPAQGPAQGPAQELHGSFTPPPFVYWDLGRPLERFAWIEQAAWSDAPGVYGRRYERGLSLVNPSGEQTQTVRLDRELYDPDTESFVSSVELRPRTGKLLLRR